MVNMTDSKQNTSSKSEMLSDLLDENLSVDDLDSLLDDTATINDLYRYQAVSAILKNEHSIQSSLSFCQEISSKIAGEPAIIAKPAIKSSAKAGMNKNSAEVFQFKRFTGGLAIAASAAFATFFSVQTLQVSENLLPGQTNQSIATSESSVNSIPKISVEIADSLEQTELEFSSNFYKNGALRSNITSLERVSGSYVKTIRISAEEWQKMLDRAIQKKAAKDAAINESSDSADIETQ